jgi:hypothetical protein
MTNHELIGKLQSAQALLADVYHWSCEMQDSKLMKNSEVASQMSCADSCIGAALDALDWDES